MRAIIRAMTQWGRRDKGDVIRINFLYLIYIKLTTLA